MDEPIVGGPPSLREARVPVRLPLPLCGPRACPGAVAISGGPDDRPRGERRAGRARAPPPSNGGGSPRVRPEDRRISADRRGRAGARPIEGHSGGPGGGGGQWGMRWCNRPVSRRSAASWPLRLHGSGSRSSPRSSGGVRRPCWRCSNPRSPTHRDVPKPWVPDPADGVVHAHGELSRSPMGIRGRGPAIRSARSAVPLPIR
jgi:hypothetical protein